MGAELRQEILSLSLGLKHREAIECGVAAKHEELRLFVDEFAHSRQRSIDAFLTHRKDLIDIGKRAIAYVLLEHENRNSLSNRETVLDWYEFLVSETTGEPFDSLDFQWLRVVTFNYDRSFETALVRAICSTYKVEEAAARQKLSSISITHVYGSLSGRTPPYDPHPDWDVPVIGYGAPPTMASVELAAQTLQVIPEGRDDSQSVMEARRLLVEAHNIAFLGFGFDALNLRRLDATRTCRRGIGERHRRIVATTLGMTLAEIKRAANLSCASTVHIDQKEPDFIDTDCLGLLRQTLILDA